MDLGHSAFDPVELRTNSVVPRHAATLILVRDVPPGRGRFHKRPRYLEVLMLRKAVRAGFSSGAHVFPGGTLEMTDGCVEIAELCSGRDDADASAQIGVSSGGLALWVAAVRECFEEAGILLAYAADGKLASFSDPEVAARFQACREALNRKKQNLLEICRDEGLTLALDRIYYFSHWITPEGMPRRYDTRFFIAEAPVDQTAHNDGSETVENRWIAPEKALRLAAEGKMALVFPTMKNLEAMSRFASAADLLAHTRTIKEVSTSLPRLSIDGREVRILLPGDPGYEDLTAEPPAGDFPEKGAL
ncbi:MAG: NUDIX hydrolase [Acidimicrobiales bacterium]